MNEQKYARVDELNAQARDLERVSPAQMLDVAQKAQELAGKLNYQHGLAWSMVHMARAHMRSGNLNEANNLLSRVQEMEPLEVEVASEAHNARGIVFAYYEAFAKAVYHFQQSLGLARQAGNREREARLLSNIGTIYSMNNGWETALEYYNTCLLVLEELEGDSLLPLVLSNISGVYLRMDDVEKTQHYADEGLREARKHNDRLMQSSVLQTLGLLNQKVGRRDEAVGYFNQSLDIYRETKETVHAVRTLVDLHKLHLEAGELDLCLQKLNEALSLTDQTDALSDTLKVLWELTKVYEELGDSDQALHYHRQCREMVERIEESGREQTLRAVGAQIAADESYRVQEAYRALNEALDQKNRVIEEGYSTLQAISTIGRSITATLDLDTVFALVHKHVADLMPADSFGVAIYDPDLGTLKYTYLIEDMEPLKPFEIAADNKSSFAAKCFREEKGFVIKSIQNDSLNHLESASTPVGLPTKSMLMQPLLLDDEAIGIVTVQSRKENAYTESNLEVLGMLASYLSIAIQNARKSHELREEIRERELAQEELQRLNAELDNLSNLDGLTGIANRRRLDDFLQLTWYTAQRQKQEVSLIMIDADYLKGYNDFYGHLAGDEVIKQLAKLMQRHVKRRTDLLARYGGDEFAIILANTGASHALELAQAITEDLERAALVNEASPLGQKMTLSIGVASLPPDHQSTPSDLIALADTALYKAKEGGRARIEQALGTEPGA